MPKKIIHINRAPVLTLWAAVVAERLGFDRAAALTLGKAVAGLNAQSKGQRLGIFEKPKDRGLTVRRKGEKEKAKAMVSLMGRAIPTFGSAGNVRAVIKDEVIDPKSVENYLSQKFGGELEEVRSVMQHLAKSYKSENLAAEAYALYEQFRPSVPEGATGWGAKGELDLALIRSLSK